MKKLTCLLTLLTIGISAAYAETITSPSEDQTINWSSSKPADVITIQNSSSLVHTVIIHVLKQNTQNDRSSGGVHITNCGDTVNIAAGSSAVCTLGEETITLRADGTGVGGALGTYRIEQICPQRQ